MPEDVVGIDPDGARAVATTLERVGRQLGELTASSGAVATGLALGDLAAAVVAPGRAVERACAAAVALLAQRAAAIERADGWRSGAPSSTPAAAAGGIDADRLREHPEGFVDAMRFALADWPEASAWYAAMAHHPFVDPTRYALLGAWRALVRQGIDEGHLVVMGDRVSGVSGAYLAPTLTIAADDSVTLGYALLDVESRRSLDWTDTGQLLLDGAAVAATAVCGVTMGAACVVAGALGVAGTAVTVTRLLQACLAEDRSSCLPELADAAVARAVPPGLLLVARASRGLDDRDGRRVRELAAGAEARDIPIGSDGVVVERSGEVTVTLRYAASVTMHL